MVVTTWIRNSPFLKKHLLYIRQNVFFLNQSIYFIRLGLIKLTREVLFPFNLLKNYIFFMWILHDNLRNNLLWIVTTITYHWNISVLICKRFYRLFSWIFLLFVNFFKFYYQVVNFTMLSVKNDLVFPLLKHSIFLLYLNL